jgi:hypothetical protein
MESSNPNLSVETATTFGLHEVPREIENRVVFWSVFVQWNG